MVKKIVILLSASAVLGFAGMASAQTYVDSYTKRDGTYVQGHYRSKPNSTTLDNYSTRGNYNPYTGKRGTRDPYGSSSYGSRGLYGSGSLDSYGTTKKRRKKSSSLYNW